MNKAFAAAANEIADTSYSCAVKRALYLAELGMTPREIFERLDMKVTFKNPTWEDVIFNLIYTHRRLGNKVLPQHAPIAQAPRGKTPTAKKLTRPANEARTKPVTRHCLKCRDKFESAGRHNHVCPSCQVANRCADGGGDLGGMYV